MMLRKMPRFIKRKQRHGMTNMSFERNLNWDNKCSSSTQDFGYFLESSSQDGQDPSP